MGLNDLFFGTPPTTSVQYAPGFKAPGYGFAKDLSSYLRTLIGSPAPSYPGQVDPGLSPTMQMLGRMTQGYSTSPAPQVMGQVAGTLGRFMNPQIQNPLEQLGRQIQNPFAPGGVGTSPGGRPGVMPGTDPGYGIPGDGNPGGGMPGGGGTSGGTGSDGGAPTVDFNSLNFPHVNLPTNSRPMFGGIDMPHGTPPFYAGGPEPAGGGGGGMSFENSLSSSLPRGGLTPPTIGQIRFPGFEPPPPSYKPGSPTPPFYARDPVGPSGRLPGRRPGETSKPKLGGGGASTSRTDPRLAEIRRRVGARPRRGR